MEKWARSLESVGLMGLNNSFWKGKRVLVTGHTGFKGGWLIQWLSQLGANVSGISLPASTTPNLFEVATIDRYCKSYIGDIRDAKFVQSAVSELKPEIVFHLAAQSLVRYGYDHPLDTLSTNIMGTATLLEHLRSIESLKVCIVITTDKVYQNQEWSFPYRETDPLGGHDPYSASKAACELVTSCYKKSYFAGEDISISTARAGNVIGGGDWSLDRIIPDAMVAWNTMREITIRQPYSIRPWQHVLEPLYGYLQLAEKSWKNSTISGSYNFGPRTDEVITVSQLIELARKCFGAGVNLVKYGYIDNLKYESKLLSLETAKAMSILGYRPVWNTEKSIQKTVLWYKNYFNGIDPTELCKADIDSYEKSLAERNLTDIG